MSSAYRPVMVVVLLAIGAALPLAAQDAPGGQNTIEQLQGKNVLADEDKVALKTWIDQRVQVISSGDPAGSVTATKEMRRAYRGSASFKEAFVATSIEAIGAAYKRAKRDAATRLITVLNLLDDVSAHPLLIEVLRDERVPVRTAAVIGLARLRPKIAGAGAGPFATVIAELRDAGKRETSAVTLKMIYGAMNYTGPGFSSPDAKANAAAVLDLLAARGEQYGKQGVKAEAADRAGLELAGKLMAQYDDPAKQRLVVACAKMLRYAVDRYTSELHKIQDKGGSPVQIALRNRVETFIITAEAMLKTLTKPETSPEVAKALQEKEADDKVIAIKIEMNKWGDLLQERYQFDVHVAEPEPEPEPVEEDEGD